MKRHFYVSEKIIQIGQNWPLEKFTHFLFLFLRLHCHVWCNKDLCDSHLTCVIHVEKTKLVHKKFQFGTNHQMLHDDVLKCHPVMK